MMMMKAILAAVLVLAVADATSVLVHMRSVNSEDMIERAFVERSTPGTALFRQHMSQVELVELVKASGETILRTSMVLEAMGAKSCTLHNTRDVLRCPVTKGTTFAAALGMTEDDFAAKPQRPRRALAVVAELQAHVAAMIVSGSVTKAPSKAGAKGVQAMPGMEQTPASIKKRYNIPSGIVPSVPSTFSQGVAEFQQSHFTTSDMDTFNTEFGLPTTVIRVDGPNTGNADRIEGTLDVQYMTAIAGNVTTWWISQKENSTDPDPMGIDFSWWCNQVLDITNPPSAVSISWGMGEYNYKHDPAVLTTDNQAFRKLGLRGISVMAASGDSGPGARRYLSCTKFMPGWPASSPYLTAVGATYATSETAAEESVDFSGGGFSDYFAAPSWQSSQVQSYLSSATGLPKSSYYNASGRGFPDVAAFGTNFKIFAPQQGGSSSSWWDVSGTSCASPTFAAIVTRLNAERVHAGKPTLGFLNPALYKLGSVGNDITLGKNVDTDCFGIIKIQGFPAAKGWDPVSGLGTPDYDFLSKNL